MPQLSDAEKEELERQACLFSKEWLFTRHYVLKRKDGTLSLMAPLRLAQRKLVALIEYFRKKNEPVRIIIGKSRKTGISTCVEADMHDEVCVKGIDGLIIANEKDLAEYVFDMTRRFHDYRGKVFEEKDIVGTVIMPLRTPALYKGKTNKRELRLHAREGRIEVETAGNTYAGTGRTPQYIHSTEVSKWEHGADTAISLFQSMGLKPGTTHIMESTFNGYDGLFLPHWEAAYDNSKLSFSDNSDGTLDVHFEVTNKDKWNGWCPLFISVLDDEDARRPFRDDNEKQQFLTTLDEYEKMVVERFQGTPEFLNWRRFALKNLCQGNLDILKQEYPLTPSEAVRASGRARFNLAKLDCAPIEEGQRGMFKQTDRWNSQIIWTPDPQEFCVRFRDKQPGHRYVAACDTAEGLLDEFGKDPDASVIHVYDLDAAMEQVVAYFGQVSEENLVTPLYLIASYYEAYVVIESNSTGKHVCIEMGKRYPRSLLYHRDDWDPDKTRMARDIGHRTHVGNRNILVGALAEAINDNAILFHCRETVMELKRFVYKAGGGTGAEKGYHDDHPMTAGMAVLGAKCYPQRRIDANRNLQYYKQIPRDENRTYL